MIYFIIIILLFILLWYYNRYQLFESLNDNLFLSKNDIIHFINIDSDHYLYNMSSADLYARNVKNINHYKKNINNNIYHLSKKEKKRLYDLYNKTNNILYKKYIDIANVNCKIVITKNNVYENGLPHTRSNIIFMSNNILNQTDHKIIQTLIHEKIHIFQRYNPYHKYIIDFLDNYGIKRFMKRNEYIKTYPLLRSNPDLDEWIYIDKFNTLSCSYKNNHPKFIDDVNCNQLNEHPFEMMAYDIVNNII
jgi:hypothetical protein